MPRFTAPVFGSVTDVAREGALRISAVAGRHAVALGVTAVLACSPPESNVAPSTIKPPSVVRGSNSSMVENVVRIAVTFDDLPWSGPSLNAGERAQGNAPILDALQRRSVPASGFVNCANVRGDTAILKEWLQANFELGNHAEVHDSTAMTAIAVLYVDHLRRATGHARVVARRKIGGPKGQSWLYRIAPLDPADATWDDAEAVRIQSALTAIRTVRQRSAMVPLIEPPE